METVAITGFGSYLPRKMLSNDMLPPFDDPISDEEIARIGVYRRGWAEDDEGIAEMAAARQSPRARPRRAQVRRY
jgi:3-oxoacyl-[acyl-carrier-protein] synthase III